MHDRDLMFKGTLFLFHPSETVFTPYWHPLVKKRAPRTVIYVNFHNSFRLVIRRPRKGLQAVGYTLPQKIRLFLFFVKLIGPHHLFRLAALP